MTYLDEEVKVAAVVVVADGCVAAGDVLAVDVGRDGDVLANGETDDILGVGELEAVAGRRIRWGEGETGMAYMAVLGEIWIFFSRGNSFQTLGSRGLVRPVWRTLE
jgi:hypothetical protein